MILSFMCLYVLLRVLEAFRQHVEICNYKLQIVSAADNFRRYNKCIYVLDCQSENYSVHTYANSEIHTQYLCMVFLLANTVWRDNLVGEEFWQIDSFQAFSERKFDKLIDQPIDY